VQGEGILCDLTHRSTFYESFNFAINIACECEISLHLYDSF